MWFNERNGRPDWSEAERHLSAVDPVMAGLIARVGPCTLAPLRRPFMALCLSIFSQQLSVKGAETLFNRFCDGFPRRQPTPERVAAALGTGPGAWDEETIRRCGLSRQKRSYLLDLSEKVLAGTVPLAPARLRRLSDEEVLARLTAVKGIGEWTAQMFMMFTLCRPDVFAPLDLGLQVGIAHFYGLDARPKPAEIDLFSHRWRPYRTLACWYLWRGKEG